MANLAGAAMGFEQTVSSMENSLKQTRSDLDDSRSEEIKLSKKLNEIANSLNERLAQLEDLEKSRKMLTEQKDNLEEQLAKLLKPGKAVASFEPVTQPRDSARRALPEPIDISLQGLVTATSDSLATISIGSADGVKEGMRLHITRGDSFICDIVITNVDSDTAAGSLQLLNQLPQVGDKASTQW